MGRKPYGARRFSLWFLPAPLLVLALVGAGAGTPRELLPDLLQQAPGGVTVTQALGGAGDAQFRLGFASLVENIGAGALVIEARRQRSSVAAMTADQLVARSDGSTRTYRSVGVVRYAEASDHAHWHLTPFERYELRRAEDFNLVARDRKVGFCVMDDYRRLGPDLPGEPSAPVFTQHCGRQAPFLLRVREGLSVGYGDAYPATLSGQYFDVTGLPAGRYVLVERVNQDRRLRESNYSNDSASLLLQLSWPGGEQSLPQALVLTYCPGSEHCSLP